MGYAVFSSVLCVACCITVAVTTSLRTAGTESVSTHDTERSTEDITDVYRRNGVTEEEVEWLREIEGQDERPGFIGRITQKGFDFAASLAINILMKELKKLSLPDLNTEIGIADVTVSGVRVTEFPRPESSLHPVPWPGYGMRWEATGLSPVIVADYTADFDLGFFTITKSGTVTVTGEDLHFNVDFFMGRDADGQPTTEILICQCDGDVSLEFEGAWSDILNVGSSLFDDRIRSLITAQICFQAKNEINTKLGVEMRKLPLTHVVKEDYLIDFSLVQAPLIYSDAMEIGLKGAVYVADDPQEPPFVPPQLSPRHEDDDRMIYLSLTDYIINSACYATFLKGLLSYSVTADMVPEEHRGYLNTTCPDDLCLGTVFTQVSSLFPDTTVAVRIQATSPPHLEVQGNKFNVTGAGSAEVYVETNGSMNDLFVIGVNISGSFETNLVGKTVTIAVLDMDTSAEIIDSSIGDIGSGFFFESILRVITQKVLIPKITEFGSKGVGIPKVKGIEFVRPIIVESETPGVFIVGTDIAYETKKKRAFVRRKMNKRKNQRQSRAQ